MTSFSVINKAPGVFIQEINVSGPIPGVGTSTAAFIGPAEKGPINKPTLLSSFPQFQDTFGGFITAPMVYAAHAVQGFFDNGGTACYFLRIGTAVRASLPLKDRSAAPGFDTLVVTAKQEGVAGNAITVQVQDASITSPVLPLVRTQATLMNASGMTATVTAAEDASQFRSGDTVFLQEGTTSERAVISEISGTTITFDSALTNSYEAGGTIRTADLFRVKDAASIQRGDLLRLAQESTPSESAFVERVDLKNKAIELRAPGLTNEYTMASDASPVTAQPFVYVIRAQADLASASGNRATLDTAAATTNFRVGDTVFLEQDETNDRAVISRIQGKDLTFQSELIGTYTGGTIRIANLAPTQRTFRVADATGLEPGSYIRLSQGSINEDLIVEGVDIVGFVTVQAPGIQNPYSLGAADEPVIIESLEFSLSFPTGPENFPNLSMEQRHSRYFAKVVDSKLVDVSLADPPSPTPPPNNLLVEEETSLGMGEPGQNDNLGALTANTYQEAINQLERVDDVNLFSIPDCVNQNLIGQDADFTQAVQKAMIDHCEKMQDRFAILDPLPKLEPLADDGILGQRRTVGSDRGFGALYYPQIIISDPVGPGRVQVAPSGHIAGIYARTDTTRGVSKAPANESMRGVLALEQTLTDDEQGPLNEQGINVLRVFSGRGSVVFGARTLSTNTQWRYVNVRRLLLFIEESIQEGTQFAVFEPNNLELRQRVTRQVTEFLTRVWRDGALFGATPEQAFRVRADEQLNPPDIRALGQLVIEVVVVPTTPAEFIVFHVIQDPTGASLQE